MFFIFWFHDDSTFDEVFSKIYISRIGAIERWKRERFYGIVYSQRKTSTGWVRVLEKKKKYFSTIAFNSTGSIKRSVLSSLYTTEP